MNESKQDLPSFALIRVDGEVAYPYKKQEKSRGLYGYALSPPGKRDRDGEGVYTEDLALVIRRVVFENWGVRAESASYDGTLKLGKRSAKHYWVAPELLHLVHDAPTPPVELPTAYSNRDNITDDEAYGHALHRADSASVEDFIRVLVDLDDKITNAQRDMLIGHAIATEQRLSMLEVARLGRYTSYEAGNMQYGILGRHIANALGIVGLANQVQSFCEGTGERDDAGHFLWTLRPAIVQAMKSLDMVPVPSETSETEEEFREVGPTERVALQKARIGQGPYRQKMLRWWGGGCAVTGCDVAIALLASHALPWRDCTNAERLDPFNGLPLIATLDRLFDAGLISFADDGSMLKVDSLPTSQLAVLGILGPLSLRRPFDPRHIPYIQKHRALNGFSG